MMIGVKKITNSFFAIFLVLVFLFSDTTVSAAIPTTIGYEGYVTNASGTPVTTSQTVIIRIYNAGGILLYSETHTGVPFSNGYFSINIGDVTDLTLPDSVTVNSGVFATLPFDVQYFVEPEITTLSTGPMTPRAPINAVAYANRSAGVQALVDPSSIMNPLAGQLYFDTSGINMNTLMVFDGTQWVPISGGTGLSSTLANGYMYIGNASNTATPAQISGDATISNAGVLTISNNAVTLAKLAADAVNSSKIVDGSIALADLGSNSVDSSKILDGSITSADISATASIIYAKLNLANSILASDLTTSSVDSSKILDGSIIAADLATDAVTSAKILDGTLTNADISNTAAIAYSKLNLANSIVLADLTTNSVNSSKIIDGSVTNADLANSSFTTTLGTTGTDITISGSPVSLGGTLTVNIPTASGTNRGALSSADWTTFNGKLSSALTSGNILVGNASNVATSTTLSGDATLTNAGVLTIGNNAVTLAKLATDAVNSTKIVDGSIALADMATGSVDTAKIVDATITNADISATAAIIYSKLNLSNSIVLGDLTTSSVDSSKILDGSIIAADLATDAVTSAKILDGTLTNADVSATAAISLSKLASGTSGQIIVANASGVPVYVALSGDATIDNTGALTIANTVITTAKIATDAVTSVKILDGTIVLADLAADSVDSSKIVDGSIVTADISNNAIDGSKISIGTTAGDTLYYDGTDWVRLPLGTAGQFLQTNGTATAPIWVTGSSTNIYNTNGTLSTARTISSGGNSLTFDGTGDIVLADSGLLSTVGLSSSGNITQTGSTTFSTGTGNISLNGNTTIANGKTLTLAGTTSTLLKTNGSDVIVPAVAGTDYLVGTLTSGNLFIGNASNVATSTTLSGDATLTNAGVLTIGNNAVTLAKLATDSVNSSKILDGSIALADLSSNSVDTAKIVDATITNADVSATAAIVYTKLNLANSIVLADLTGDSVNSSKIVDGSIVAADLATDSITTGKVLDGTLTNADINASAAIALSKLASGTSGQLIVANTSGIPTYVALSGDATIDDIGALTIANLAITNAKLASDAVTTGKILDGTITAGDLGTDSVTTVKILDGNITTAKILDANVTLAKLAADSVNSSKIVDGSIATGDIADNAIDGTKLGIGTTAGDILYYDGTNWQRFGIGTSGQVLTVNGTTDGFVYADALTTTLADNKILLGNGSNIATAVTLTGDVTSTNAGVLTIGNNAVTLAKLATDSVNSSKILDGSIALADLSSDSVDTAKIVDATITNADISATAAIVYTKLNLANSIVLADLTGDSVNSSKIVDGSIVAADLATDSITTGKVLDGTLTNADVSASAAIALSKLASGTSGQLIVANTSGIPTYVALSGDATIDDMGALTIANLAITNAKLASDAVTTGKILDGTITAGDLGTDSVTTVKILDGNITTAKILDANVTLAKLAADSVNSSKIVDGSIATGDIADNAIDGTKLGIGTTAGDILYYDGTNWQRFGIGTSGQVLTVNGTTDGFVYADALTTTLADNKILLGNGSNIATAVTLTGDVTSTNAGVLTIGNNAVTLAKLATDSVNSSKILDGSIALADLSSDSVDTAKIVDATITNADISATAAIVYTKLNLANSIVLADLTGDSVNSSKIVDGSIVAADLATDSITTGKVLDGTLTNADINASAAIALSKLASGTSGQLIVANTSGIPTYVALSGDATIDDIGALTIANLAITNAKLASDAVTTGKILDGTITAGDLGTDSVTTVKILDGNITTAKILDANVTLAKLAADSVNSSKIVDGSIATGDIADNAIDGTKLGIGTTAGDILYYDGTNWQRFGIGTSGQVLTVNGTTDGFVYADALTTTLADNKILLGNGSNIATAVTLTGDVTSTNAGVLTIGNNAVTLAKLATDSVNSSKILDGSIALADLSSDSVDTAKIVDATITNADISATAAIVYTKLNLANSIVLADLTGDSVNSSKIVDGSIVAADLATDSITTGKVLDGTLTNADVSASAAIALSKLASGTSGQLIVANTSGIPTYVALSGDATIDDMGALTIANLAITNAKLASDAVTTGKILDGTITAGDLGTDSVTTVKILDGNITTAKILDANVTLAKLAADSVNSSKIVDGSIATGDIADNAIDGTKLGIGTTAGDILYYDGTNWQRFGIGTSGQVLTVNGTTDGFVYADALTTTLADNKILLGNGSNIATAVTLTGDVTSTNAGVLTIGNNAVTLAKLATDSVNSSKILDGSIALADLSSDSVDTAKIVDATITNADISATAAIVYTKLNLANSIVLADLTGDSVNSSKIVDGSIVAADLATDSITTGKVLDGTLTNADVSASAAIALSKLASGTSGQLIVANTSGIPTYVALSGDATIDDMGALTIANLAITNAKLASDAVTTGKILDGTITAGDLGTDSVTTVKILDGNITTAKILDANVTLAKLAADSVNSSKIVDGSIATGDIADNAIDGTKLGIGTTAGDILYYDGTNWQRFGIGTSGQVLTVNGTTDGFVYADALTTTLADNKILLGNGSNIATAVTLTGDVTSTNAGVLTIGNNAVTLAKLATDSVNSSKILDGSIALADLSSDSVDTAKIVDATITNADISATAAIVYTKLNLANSIVLADLTGDSVNSSKIVDGSIVAADLATDSITTGKVLDGTLTNADINASAAIALSKLASGTSGQLIVANTSGIPTYVALSGDATIDDIGALTIANLAITNAKLASDAVTTGKILDGTITAGDLGTDSVTTVKILDGNITTAKILDANVTLAKLAADSVNSSKIVDGSIATGDIADNAIDGTKLGIGTTAGDILYYDGTNWQRFGIGTSGQVLTVNGTTDGFVYADALTTTLADNKILLGNGSNIATAVTLTGDVTSTNAGVLTIGNNAVTLAKLATDSVNSSKILDGSIALADLSSDSVDTAKIVDATITNADINASAAIALSKLASGTSIVTSLTTPSGSNANGGSIASNVLTLSLADGTNPGLVSTGTQSFAGVKTFLGNLLTEGNTTLGNAGADTLTFNANTLSIPNNLNVDTNTLFVDSTNNRVAVGLNNPTVSFAASGTNASGATTSLSNYSTSASQNVQTLRLNVGNNAGCSSAATCPRFLNYYKNVTSGDTGGTALGHTRISNTGTGVTATSGAADFAEYMLLNAASTDGDIVGFGGGVKRIAESGDPLLGAVSNNAAFVANGSLEGTPNAAVVGFAGVVNTKVNTSNGNISAGDPITVSTTPGVGMKQTASGYTLGYALGTYSAGGTGMIDIFVAPKYTDVSVINGGSSGSSGFFTRTGTSIAPTTAGDTLTTSGDITTTGTGALTIAGNTTLSALSSGILHSNSSGVLSSSLVVSADIDNGTIALVDLAADSVNSSKIVDGSIATGDIADNAIDGTKLGIGTTAGDILYYDGTNWQRFGIGTSGQVLTVNGTTDGFVYADALTTTLADNKILLGNGSNIATAVTLTGDVTSTNAGVLTIGNNAVTLAKLATDSVNSSKILDGSIALADLSSDSVDTAKIVDATITNADISATAAIVYTKLNLANSIVLADLTGDSVNSSKIVDGSIVAADLATDSITTGKVLDGTLTNADVSASAAIALSKLASGTSGQLIVANTSGIPTYVALSGDATIDDMGALTIANLAITNAKLASDAVTTGKILDGTITAGDLGTDSVTTVKILDGNITTAKILDANVTLAKLAADSVNSSKIVDGSIATGDIADNAIDGTKLGIGTTAGDILYYDGTNWQRFGIGTSGQVLTVNGTTDGFVYADALTTTLADNKILLGNGSNIATAVTLTGDVTSTNAGVLTIGNNAVTLAKLATDSVNSSKILDGSIALADLSSDSVDTAKIVDATITNADISATAAIVYTKLNLANSIVLADLTGDSVNSSKIVDGSIVAADLATDSITTGKVLDGTLTNADVSASAAIALSKLASGTSGQLIVANTSGIPTYVALSGDATIDDMGALTIANLAITNAKLASDAVTTGKILDGTITAGDLGTDSVTTVKILDGNITTAKILDANVTLAKLAADSVNSSKIVDGSIATGDIADNAIDGTKLGIGTTAGDILYYDGTNWQRFGIGTSGQVLTVNGTTDGFVYADALTTTLADNKILLGNGSNIATAVTLTGDVTSTNAGVLTIGNNAVTLAKLATDSVNSSKILDGSIALADLSSDSVDTAKIVDATITNADINASAAIALSKLASGTSIVTSLTTPSGSNANGGSIASNVLTLSLADGTNPGLVSTGTQSFAGVKTFLGNLLTEGNTTLGNAGADTLTFNANTLSIPNNLNVDTNTLFVDSTNNRVAVGLNNPTVSFAASGTNASGATTSLSNYSTSASQNVQTLRLNVGNNAGCSSAATCPRFLNYYKNVTSGDTGGTALGHTRISNTGTGVTATSGAADFAEYMLLNAASTDGDIVGFGGGVKRIAESGDPLLGAVSNNAAFVANGSLEGTPNAAVVGFAGVVNTKVNTSNGNISAGDPITVSTTPGVGMKQTASGYTLGYALGTYSAGGTGMIDIFVAPKYTDVSVINGGSSGSSGFFTRTGTSIAPTTAGDTLTTSGDITTTGTGALTIAGNTTLSALSSGILHSNSSGVLSSSLVVSADIDNGTIALVDLAADSVNSSKIVDGSIATGDIADNAIDGTKLGIGTTAGDILYYDGTNWQRFGIGTSGQVLTVNGTTDGFVYADALTTTLADNKILLGNGSNIATAVTLTGDVTSTNAGVLTIGNNAVTLAKLATDSVNSSKILDGSIALADLSSDSVDTAKIVDATITNADISATAAIVYTKLNLANSIVLADLTGDSVNSSKIVDGSIVAADLATDSITTGKVLDGTLTNADVSASAAIALSKLASGTSGQLIVANTSGIPTYVALSGDATIDDMGALTIANLAITNAKLASDAVTTGKILDGTITAGDLGTDSVTTVKILDGNITTAKILDANVTLAKLAADSVNSSKIVDGSIATGDIADNAIDGTKLGIGTTAGDILYYDGTNWQRFGIGTSGQVLTVNGTTDGFVYADALTTTLADNKILLGNGSNIATAVTLTGDVTSTNAGVLTIGNNAVTLAKLATDSVNSSKILDGSIALADLSSDSVDTAKIVDATITNADISATAAIVYTKLNLANSIVLADLTGDSVNSSKIVDGSIVAADLATDAVTSTKVLDGTLTNADINASAAISLSKLASGTSGQLIVANASGVPTYVALGGDATVDDTGALTIANLAITSAKLNTDAVTTGKILDGTIASADLGTDSVTTVKILDGNITTAKILDANVTLAKLAADSVNSSKIVDGSIATGDIADNAIDGTKLGVGTTAGDILYYDGTNWQRFGIGTAGQVLTVNGTTDGFVYADALTTTLADNKILLGNGSNIATAVTLTGDVTSTNAGVLTIGNNAVTLAKLATDSVNSSKILDGSIALADLSSDSVDTAKIVDATITNADVSATAAIIYSKLNLANSIVLADLTTDSVNSAKIVDGSIVAADLATDAVTSTKVLDGTLTNADINASAAISLSKLASGTSIVTSLTTPTGSNANGGSIASNVLTLSLADGTNPGLVSTGAQSFAGAKTFLGNLLTEGNTTLGNAGADTLTFNANTLSIPNNLNVDTNTLFVDSTNNRVAVGLNNPTVSFAASGTNGAGSVASLSNYSTSASQNVQTLRLNVGNNAGCSSAATCPRFLNYYKNVTTGDTGGTALGHTRISNAGTGVTATSGAADFAEYMLLSTASSDGDIVGFGGGVKRIAQSGDPLLGAISNNAAFIANGSLEGTPNAAVVGFAGVVTTKVNTSNGNINDGDPITVSTTPGIGMKQTGSGYTLGYALGSYSAGGTGMIDIFVAPKYTDVSVINGGSSGSSGFFTRTGTSIAPTTAGDTLTTSGDITTTGTGALTIAGNTTLSALSSGILHSNSSGVLSSSLVVSADIDNGTIALVDLAADSVNSSKIVDGSIATGDIADNAIDGTKLGIGTTAGDILYYDGTNWQRFGIGTSGQVLTVNGTTDGFVYADALTTTLADNKILLGNGSNIATAVTLTGDVTSTNAGVLTIGNNAVTLAKLATDSVNSSKILDGSIALADLSSDSVDTAKIVDATITNADINASAAIALSKLASGTSIVTSLTTPSGSNANGGSIASNVLTLSLADGTNPGLVSTGTQSFAGVKSFTSLLTGSAGATISGATTSINVSSNFATNINTGTSTGAVSIGNSLAGALVLTTGSTASLTSGTTNALTLDSGTTGAINIGTNANAKTITLGNATGATMVNITAGSGGITNTGNVTTTGTGTIRNSSATDDRLVLSAAAIGAATFNGTLTNADLTAARTYTLPDATGTLALYGSISGDATATNAGVLTIGTGAVTTTKILDANVTLAKLATDSVNSTKIVDASIATADIANNAIDGTKIGLGTTAGDIMYYDGTDWQRFAPGTNGQVLATTGTGLIWSTSANTIYAGNGTLTGARTITTGGNSLTIDGTGDIIFADSGLITSVGLTTSGNITQTGVTTLSTGTGAISLNGNTSITGSNTLTVGTGITTLGGNLAVNGGTINSTGALIINSGTATALTLDSGTTGAINIGTNANAKTITLGNTTGATALNLLVGSAGLSVTGTGTNTVPLVTYTNGAGNFQTFISGTNPESTVTGSLGDITHDVVGGEVYIKKTGTATNTGWQRILTSTGGTLATGSIPFQGSSGQLTEDNTLLYYDDINNRLGFGTNTPGAIGGISTIRLEFADDTGSNSDVLQRVAGGGWGAYYHASSRGTKAVPTISQANDTLGEDAYVGYNGTSFSEAARIVGSLDGTPTGSSMPGKLQFYTTPTGSITPLERMKISQAGIVTINDDLFVNGGDINTTATTASLFSTNVTTLSIGSNASTLSLGNATLSTVAGTTFTGGGTQTIINSRIATPLTIDSGTIGNLNIGSGSFAKQIIIGNSTSTTGLIFLAGSTGFSVNSVGTTQISSIGVPTSDVFKVSNAGNPSITNGVNGAEFIFGSSNASGNILHLTPSYTGGATDLLTYNFIGVDAFSPTNSAGTDTINGLSLGNLTDPGATITSNGLLVGTGWDSDLTFNDVTPNIKLGVTDNTGILSIIDNCTTGCVNGGTTANKLMQVRDLSTNFGGLVESGAFLGHNSYFSQEFNADTSNGITADSANIGDDLNMYFDTTSTTMRYTALDGVGGFGRLTAGTTSGVGGLIGLGSAQNNLSLIFAKANLPVVQMKVRTNINNTTNDIFWGLMDQATAPTANDTKPANGIYFWNNNAAGGWQGVVRSGGADVGTVTCSGSISTSQFAVGRIQVESTTSVRFLMDYDVSNGVDFTDCGTVSGANPSAALGIAIYNIHTETTGSRTVDVDYMRVWQDDPTEDLSRVFTQITEESPIRLFDFNDQKVEGLEFITNVQSEVNPNVVTKIAEYMQSGLDFTTDIITARITAIRGYFDEIFTKKIHTEQLCVKKSDGGEVCVNGDQLQTMIDGNTTTTVIVNTENQNSGTIETKEENTNTEINTNSENITENIDTETSTAVTPGPEATQSEVSVSEESATTAETSTESI